MDFTLNIFKNLQIKFKLTRTEQILEDMPSDLMVYKK